MSQEQRPDQRRKVRSFVRRPGRLTAAQRHAIETLLPQFSVPPQCRDLRLAFPRLAELVVEIGFGNGAALARMARQEPERQFVGIEVHEPGVGRLLRAIRNDGLENVRVAMRDAVEVLNEQTLDQSIDAFRIFFPDPWPKKRHHKRRLIQPPFAGLLARRLKPGGLLHLATDWQPYADWMLEVLDTVPELVNLGSPWVERPAWRPETHFENRGRQRGHLIRDLLYRKRV